jgi:hypothetical protein
VWNVAGANPTEPSSNLAFLVTGLNFPDALAARPWAGGTDAQMFLVPGGSVPNGVIDDLNGLDVALVVLVGGPSVLTEPVAQAEIGGIRTQVGGLKRGSRIDRFQCLRGLSARYDHRNHVVMRRVVGFLWRLVSLQVAQ